MHKWGCHSFEGGRIHAIFEMYADWPRLRILWWALTKHGIIGLVYSSEYGGMDKGIEQELEHMGDYGIVHGVMQCDTHNYNK